MRIVHYISEVVAEHGGVVKAVLDLCGALSNRGHEVTLLTQNPQDVPKHWDGTSGTPTVVRTNFPRNPLAHSADSIFDEALQRAEVVHLHTPWELTNIPFSRHLRRRAIPYVVSIHGMLDDWCMAQRGLKKRIFLAATGRRFLERASRVHCTAEGERQQAIKWVPKAHTIVLPLLVDLSEYDTLPGAGPAIEAYPQLATVAPKLLFLSRLHPKKGVEVLLRAAAEVARCGIDLQLFIAGPGDDNYVNRLKRLANDLDLGTKTHFLGMVRGVQKTSLYQAADLFVLPTHQENFGLVLVEALACGTPVITTSGVDIWPELQQAGSAIVEAEPQAVATALLERLAQRDRLPEIGAQGQEFVRDWLAEEKVIAGYEAMYAEVAHAT